MDIIHVDMQHVQPLFYDAELQTSNYTANFYVQTIQPYHGAKHITNTTVAGRPRKPYRQSLAERYHRMRAAEIGKNNKDMYITRFSMFPYSYPRAHSLSSSADATCTPAYSMSTALGIFNVIIKFIRVAKIMNALPYAHSHPYTRHAPPVPMDSLHRVQSWTITSRSGYRLN
eukprot:scpid79364/ scgid6148/ 